MGKKHFEKDYDDQVYEDEYYEEHYNEEELSEDGEAAAPASADGDSDDERDWDKEKKVVISFACEDCDYRWEDQIIKPKDELDEEEEFDVICPMCGSINITQI